MLGTDYLLNALAQEDIDHLFMVPGGLVDPFLPALGRQTAVRPIVAAQEGGAAYMADGYARASGKFGATLCIGGPGLGNTVTPMATAKTDGSPLLLLTGEVGTAVEGLGMFQDASSQTLDDVDVMKPVTRYSSSGMMVVLGRPRASTAPGGRGRSSTRGVPSRRGPGSIRRSSPPWTPSSIH